MSQYWSGELKPRRTIGTIQENSTTSRKLHGSRSACCGTTFAVASGAVSAAEAIVTRLCSGTVGTLFCSAELCQLCQR